MTGPKPTGHFSYNDEHSVFMAHREANRARDAAWSRQTELDFRLDPPVTERRSSGFQGSDSGRHSGQYTDCSSNMNSRDAQPYATTRAYNDNQDGFTVCKDCQEEYNRRGTQSACQNCQQKSRFSFSGAYQASPPPPARLPPNRGLPCNSTTNNRQSAGQDSSPSNRDSQAGPGFPHLFVGPAHERYCQKCGCKAPCYESCKWAKQ